PHHGPEPSVTEGECLQPVARGLAVPKAELFAGDRAHLGCDGRSALGARHDPSCSERGSCCQERLLSALRAPSRGPHSSVAPRSAVRIPPRIRRSRRGIAEEHVYVIYYMIAIEFIPSRAWLVLQDCEKGIWA